MKCAFEPCQRDSHPKSGFGLCGQHYRQRRSGQALAIRAPKRRYAPGETCAFISCEARPVASGLCGGHAQQRASGKALSPLRLRHTGCKVSGCEGEHNAHGWCLNHFTIWNVHGLDPVIYEQMFVDQGHVCKICSKACVSRRRLSVDHDHETGAIRGLLCAKCNRAIGLLGDDPALVFRAAEYLAKAKPLKKVA